MGQRRSRAWLAGVGVLVVLAGLASEASAATTRYAAPGATGVDPCTNPSAPCSIYTAASNTAPGTSIAPGDDVVLAPGNYTDADLGPPATNFVQVANGVTVHGAVGQPRPVITREDPNTSLQGAFFLGPTTTLSHVDIESSAARTSVWVAGGTLQDSIIRSSSTFSSTIACVQNGGTIRDTVCRVA